MFSNRNLLTIVALVGSIHAASADEASDAVQVLLKLWEASDANSQVLARQKIIREEFVGDGKIYKMRHVVRDDDGKVRDSIDEAPFRFLEEDESAGSTLYAVVSDRAGVKCLFRRPCINITTLTYDPIYNPNAQPEMSRSRPMFPESNGAVMIHPH
jgi:hypothetical protein